MSNAHIMKANATQASRHPKLVIKNRIKIGKAA